MNIGDRIKQRRVELGLDADDLAKRIGKSRATVYRYENGDIENMPTTVLEPIAKALNTTPAFLMGWSESEKSAILNAANEFKKISDRTDLFIKIFESYGYEISVSTSTVELIDLEKSKYIIDRKEFMGMVQRCHKDITWNIEKLISENVPESNNSYFVNAANQRPDATQEDIEKTNKVMTDDKEWE